MRFDCAQMENEFLRKRLQQVEERLDSELTSRKELEQQVRGSRESASQKRQRLGRGTFSSPLFKVLTEPGEGEKGHPPFHVFHLPVIIKAAHCGTRKIVSLTARVLLWGRVLGGIRNMNINSGYLSSGAISALTLQKSRYILGLRFLIYKTIIICS